MFICPLDNKVMALRLALKCVLSDDLPMSDYEYDIMLEAAKEDDLVAKANIIKKINGIHAICEKANEMFDYDFFGGDKWFAEAGYSNKSACVLYNTITNEYIVVTYYDKQFDLYMVEYPDADSIPPELVVVDPGKSLTECSVDRSYLMDRYNTALVLQR